MVYLYDACDQISDFCHQQLLRKMRRKISWTDRGKTVYPPPPSGSGGIIRLSVLWLEKDKDPISIFNQMLGRIYGSKMNYSIQV